MRKQKFTFAIMCCSLLCLLALPELAAAQAKAHLVATPAGVKAGEVPEGPAATTTITLENTGNAPLNIKDIHTNCACTTATLGKTTLQPHEKTTLFISYQTEGRPGPFLKNATLSTDIADQPEIEIDFVGTVKEAPGSKIQVTPRRTELGAMPATESKEVTVNVANIGVMPLHIKKIVARDGSAVYFNGAAKGDLTIAPGASVPVKFALKLNTPGAFTKVIVIDSDGRNAPKTGFSIMVVGEVK